MDLEAARIERPAEAANDTALAGGIPAFKHDQGSLRTAKVSLLYELKHALDASISPSMPWRHLDDPAHWRARAIEARTVAEHIADSLSKQMMLNVAAAN
jgi:hypothetical protein